MQITLNRLDPHVPDPVESRRRAAGRVVRIAYATTVFGILGFFVVYFGAPLIFLSGSGTVSAPRHVVSAPYTVQIVHMNVAPGAKIRRGEEIGQVLSPEQDGIVATYLRALADIAGRRAELRVKARVAQDTLEAARAYLRLTEQGAERIEATPAGTLTYRVQMLRERALAQKAVIGQQAEVAESTTQLADLDQIYQDLRSHLDEANRNFNRGLIVAPIDGVVSTNLAHQGQALATGTAIAEILDSTDIFVDWYVPNERLSDPKVGNDVFVLFGNRRMRGTIVEILPVSGVYAAAQPQLVGARPSTQIARVRLKPGTQVPPLNSTVAVHMHYFDIIDRIAVALVRLVALN